MIVDGEVLMQWRLMDFLSSAFSTSDIFWLSASPQNFTSHVERNELHLCIVHDQCNDYEAATMSPYTKYLDRSLKS